ncbi:ATP-grasp fold amidoligase family protein [Staphylococcus saprophyticus]|nr:ATP-grasp fold amidoligase family protein [Staphylococcus saprophyticus]
MREHLIAKGYSEILPPFIGVYKSFREIDFNQLPKKVFLKTNHTSGINQAIVNGETDLKKTNEKFEKALQQNYYDISREWNYKI